MPEYFSPALREAVTATIDANHVSELDRTRGEKMRAALRITADQNGGVADLGAALRMVLLSDQDLFEEVAYLQKRDHNAAFLQESYDRFARSIVDGKNSFQRATEITADAGAGDVDFGGLFVEGSIKKRIESESKLISMLDQKRQQSKQHKHPKSSNVAKAAFAAVSADLTDLTNTIDVGFDNTTIETEKFGATMFLEQEAFVKLDAGIVSQIIDELSIAYRRGMIDQIVNGDGNAPNATGLATNATAVTFAGNITETLVKMIAAVANLSRSNLSDLYILTNGAGQAALLGEKFINQAYENMIKILVGGGEFAGLLPVVVEDVIVTSGSSPNVAAPLYVGVKGDYLYSVQRDPKIELDKYSDFKAGGETARIMGFWHGAPHWNDSFASTTIPTIY